MEIGEGFCETFFAGILADCFGCASVATTAEETFFQSDALVVVVDSLIDEAVGTCSDEAHDAVGMYAVADGCARWEGERVVGLHLT